MELLFVVKAPDDTFMLGIWPSFEDAVKELGPSHTPYLIVKAVALEVTGVDGKAYECTIPFNLELQTTH